MLLLGSIITTQAQEQKIERVQPKWWFGLSGAANVNTYRGTTQMLTNTFATPTAFHKGKGVKPYASILTEYRPNKVFGISLNIAYDNRGGKFDEVMAPCNCPANLSTNLSYIAIEPTLRIAPFKGAFYIFGGPTLGINLAKKFTYTQDKQTDLIANWDDVRKTVLSAQVGLGFDFRVSNKSSETQMTISPFASFQTDLGQAARTVETWTVHTVRAGIALKFGTSKKAVKPLPPIHDTIYKYIHDTVTVKTTTPATKDISLIVRGPKVLPVSRQTKETFPIRNSVFFDKGSSEIPNRYVLKSATEAYYFKEQQLQEDQPGNIKTERSARQMAVYYNILNVLGDRMRNNPSSSIMLSGASEGNPSEGKVMAEKIKSYLVDIYSIASSRIETEGRSKPVIPSEQPGATKYLSLLREGDRRVDITSTSPEMMVQVGGKKSVFLKPVQINPVTINPLDSRVVFTVENAESTLSSYMLELKDEFGVKQNFGPFTKNVTSIEANTILGNNNNGNYGVTLIGKTKEGKTITKEGYVSFSKIKNPNNDGLRYSILFDFDKSLSIASYEKFLTDVVAPLIPINSTVIISGHSDIIGDPTYNKNLSTQRAISTQKILAKAVTNAGKKNVKFEATGFGENKEFAPFDNTYPEERFYNRTVIIDIIPNK